MTLLPSLPGGRSTRSRQSRRRARESSAGERHTTAHGGRGTCPHGGPAGILAWSIVSTALHYTHNFVAIADYPQATWISDTGVRVAIVVAWPLLTALAVWAYRQYARGNLRQAHVALAVY